MKKWMLSLVLLLVACSPSQNENRPHISSHADPTPHGMTYEEFRDHTRSAGGPETHKRFFALDRNNDGRISKKELGNYQ